jgi:hypothetical protein
LRVSTKAASQSTSGRHIGSLPANSRFIPPLIGGSVVAAQ